MTNPDQPPQKQSYLCRHVRRMDTLWSAWIAVRSKALHSRNEETVQDARQVEQNPVSHLRTLQEALRKDTFEFSLQKGIVKKRDGKKPRPIVVAPVPNRIVQRAILDTIQSDKSGVKERLGRLPTIMETPTSVGAVPGRGAPDAVRMIGACVENGANAFIRSDIRDFFTKVPTADLIRFIRTETKDAAFATLVERGLEVELANADDPRVREWLDLFPDGDVGVPQGSSLSALCANIVLEEFDRATNGQDITTIRYIDDFLILGNSTKSVDNAWRAGNRVLKKLGLEAHAPAPGSPKAAKGQIEDGFEFLSYRFKGKSVGVAKAAKARLLSGIDAELAAARAAIWKNLKNERRAESKLVQTLDTVDRKVRGWGDSFRDANQRVEFAQLDDQITKKIDRFLAWYFKLVKGSDTRSRMRALGIALLVDTPRPSGENAANF